MNGIKFNPIQVMYYVLPACVLALLPAWYIVESERLLLDKNVWLTEENSYIFLLNCISAFLLNYSIFLLIQNCSALTVNVSGVVKDFLLIYLSTVIFGDSLKT